MDRTSYYSKAATGQRSTTGQNTGRVVGLAIARSGITTHILVTEVGARLAETARICGPVAVGEKGLLPLPNLTSYTTNTEPTHTMNTLFPANFAAPKITPVGRPI